MTHEDWDISDSFETDAGEPLSVGSLFKVNSLKGDFRFHRHVSTPRGNWIDCTGPIGKREQSRSFTEDRISRLLTKDEMKKYRRVKHD